MFNSLLINNSLYFRLISYLVCILGFIALIVTGGINVITAPIIFILVVLCGTIENTKFQLSERIALIVIVIFIIFYFCIWQFQFFGVSEDGLTFNLLGYLIVSVGIIKLFQKKNERDWIFLYLISFFEILLAAGSSISLKFLICLIFYLFAAISSIVALEIFKSFKEVHKNNQYNKRNLLGTNFRLLLVSLSLLLLIGIFAIPIFFFLPRTGASGINGNLQNQNNTVGYSNSIELGKIGSFQENRQIVMRVEVESRTEITTSLKKWRGITLDYFDNKSWRKSNIRDKPYRELVKNIDNQILLKPYTNPKNETIQKVVLESIDSPTIFSLYNPLELYGDLNLVFQDSEGSITSINDSERIGYTVKSDASLPSEDDLISDNTLYSEDYSRYLLLPQIDKQIKDLAENVVLSKNAVSRYQKAREIESYLQNNFTYTLDLKVSGSEPLADFLFDKKAGHCEYFATAMAVMLRTQGVATRIVNGFQFGEYNETANVYVVKQKDAHSWVEVYFPKYDTWIPFDPTPSSGLISGGSDVTFIGKLSSYVEALETLWIQYFVSYDNKNQRSFFRKVKTQFSVIQKYISDLILESKLSIVNWWNDLSGEKGFEARLYAIIRAISLIIFSFVVIFFLILIGKKVWRFNIWKKFFSIFSKNNEYLVIEFHERMIKALAKQGFTREVYQTPLEFALGLNIDEAVKITENYQRVRFGKQTLSNTEIDEIENWLKIIEANK